ncbi:MAG TPA: DUF2905 domain-containing protein [Anaeromyxobacteraceae bacterium]|nr:DUF2905 domain-containing protein [Anaeromyxobacteraceae bacterium]
MPSLGRTLLTVGLLLALVGAALLVAERLPWLRLGRLPGDLRLERGSFRFYFPLGTSILLSVVLSLLFWLFGRR